MSFFFFFPVMVQSTLRGWAKRQKAWDRDGVGQLRYKSLAASPFSRINPSHIFKSSSLDKDDSESVKIKLVSLMALEHWLSKISSWTPNFLKISKISKSLPNDPNDVRMHPASCSLRKMMQNDAFSIKIDVQYGKFEKLRKIIWAESASHPFVLI